MKHVHCDVCGKEIKENSEVTFTAFYIADKTFQIEVDLCAVHLQETIKMLKEKFRVEWEKVDE